MALTVNDIYSATSDKELLDKLCAELDLQLPPNLLYERSRLFPATGSWIALNTYVAELRKIQPGLRAMAATHQLDVSMALDDLGWHFYNWHHLGYCDQTSEGLWELEATEVARIFDQAYRLVLPYWDDIGDMLATGVNEFGYWYYDSALAKALRPLNAKLWGICEESMEFRLMRYWLQYARRFPDRVATVPSEPVDPP